MRWNTLSYETTAAGCVTIASFRVNVSLASGLNVSDTVDTFLILIEVQLWVKHITKPALSLHFNSYDTLSPRFSSYYDLPFTVGPKAFFLGAAEGWGLGLGTDAGFLVLGCKDLRPRISQYVLHWCKALNWSMKEVAQFPLKPLYLKRK